LPSLSALQSFQKTRVLHGLLIYVENVLERWLQAKAPSQDMKIAIHMSRVALPQPGEYSNSEVLKHLPM
jgi:hypothetical protein